MKRSDNSLQWIILFTIIAVVTTINVYWLQINKTAKPDLKTEKKPDINITIYVPDRDIAYSNGTLPPVQPKWKVGMRGKL